MDLNKLAAALGELDAQVASVSDKKLQADLQMHTEAMMRQVFRYCVEQQKQQSQQLLSTMTKPDDVSQPHEPAIRFPSSRYSDINLADAATKRNRQGDSIF